MGDVSQRDLAAVQVLESDVNLATNDRVHDVFIYIYIYIMRLG